jgi:hypothetical protein
MSKDFKNTHTISKTIENFTYKIDGQYLKLVDKATDEIVARFIHHTLVDSSNFGKKGDIEIKRGFSEKDWDKIVILSSLARQEFLQ